MAFASLANFFLQNSVQHGFACHRLAQPLVLIVTRPSVTTFPNVSFTDLLAFNDPSHPTGPLLPHFLCATRESTSSISVLISNHF